MTPTRRSNRKNSHLPGIASQVHLVRHRSTAPKKNLSTDPSTTTFISSPPQLFRLHPGSRRGRAGSRGFPNGSAKCRARGGLRVRCHHSLTITTTTTSNLCLVEPLFSSEAVFRSPGSGNGDTDTESIHLVMNRSHPTSRYCRT